MIQSTSLKEMLISAPVIWNPDFTRPFMLQTDASGYGVGAVLSQYDDKRYDHPVATFSLKLLLREQNYSTIEKECLAIKLGVQASISSVPTWQTVYNTD